MAIIGVPTVGASETYCYVVNLLTGAWAKYTGWDIVALAELGDIVFFASPSGGIFITQKRAARMAAMPMLRPLWGFMIIWACRPPPKW